MSKFLKWLLIILAALFVIAYFGYNYMKSQTKKASPEEVVTFHVGELNLEVDYSRPSKKGRAIFGGLVPYGKVWRTGANEATTVTINKDMRFGNVAVKAGKYTLWSIPGADEWSVILNSKMYGWGVNFDGEAQRDPMADVAQVKVPVRHIVVPMEQFTIAVEGDPTELTLTWDDVQVGVPVAVQ
jgi:hypothetical protein